MAGAHYGADQLMCRDITAYLRGQAQSLPVSILDAREAGIAAIALLVWGTHIVRTGMLRVLGENLRTVLGRSFSNRPPPDTKQASRTASAAPSPSAPSTRAMAAKAVTIVASAAKAAKIPSYKRSFSGISHLSWAFSILRTSLR